MSAKPSPFTSPAATQTNPDTRPWNGQLNLIWEPNTELFEYVCQEQNYAHELMVGQGTKVDRRTLIVP